jgi:hypothetical protein
MSIVIKSWGGAKEQGIVRSRPAPAPIGEGAFLQTSTLYIIDVLP